MKDNDLKLYFNVLKRNWKTIALFIAVTLTVSIAINFGIKKPQPLVYNASGSINFNVVVYPDKTRPSTAIDISLQNNIIDQSAADLKLDKNQFKIEINAANPLIVAVNGASQKKEELMNYINQILSNYIKQIKAANNINNSNLEKLLQALNDEYRKKAVGANGNISFEIASKRIEDVLKREKELTDKNDSYKTIINMNEINKSVTRNVINDLKERIETLDNPNKEYALNKIIDLQIQLNSYIYSNDLYNKIVDQNKDELKQIEGFKQIYQQLSNDQVFNSTVKVNAAQVNKVSNTDTRVRAEIVLAILAFLLACCFVLGREYFCNGKLSNIYNQENPYRN